MKDLVFIEKKLKGIREEIRKKYKAEILGIFGSYARGEQKRGSDVDILVKFDEGATLIDFVGLSIYLENKLRIKVDIIPIDSIREEIRDKILKEAIFL